MMCDSRPFLEAKLLLLARPPWPWARTWSTCLTSQRCAKFQGCFSSCFFFVRNLGEFTCLAFSTTQILGLSRLQASGHTWTCCQKTLASMNAGVPRTSWSTSPGSSAPTPSTTWKIPCSTLRDSIRSIIPSHMTSSWRCCELLSKTTHVRRTLRHFWNGRWWCSLATTTSTCASPPRIISMLLLSTTRQVGETFWQTHARRGLGVTSEAKLRKLQTMTKLGQHSSWTRSFVATSPRDSRRLHLQHAHSWEPSHRSNTSNHRWRRTPSQGWHSKKRSQPTMQRYMLRSMRIQLTSMPWSQLTSVHLQGSNQHLRQQKAHGFRQNPVTGINGRDWPQQSSAATQNIKFLEQHCSPRGWFGKRDRGIAWRTPIHRWEVCKRRSHIAPWSRLTDIGQAMLGICFSRLSHDPVISRASKEMTTLAKQRMPKGIATIASSHAHTGEKESIQWRESTSILYTSRMVEAE